MKITITTRGWSFLLSSVLCYLCLTGCKRSGAPGIFSSQSVDTVVYIPSDTDFANPERGFYRDTRGVASNYKLLDTVQMKAWRTSDKAAFNADYPIYSTLVFRSFVLDSFTGKPLSLDLLQKIQTDFNRARQAGVKLIVRFSYTDSAHPGNCSAQSICPPFGDAPKNIVLQHIAQLTPLLQANEDVIVCMQLGFIGIWGEGFYSDYFGFPTVDNQHRLLDSNWKDRADVLRALLRALPEDRMIQVRIPQYKIRYVYGVDAPTSSAPLTDAEAFSGSDKARIGMHDDCTLAGPGDEGTYNDEGNSSSPSMQNVPALMAYAEADNKFVAVSGQTCTDSYIPQNECEPTGMAQTVLRNLHFSFLDGTYNNALNNTWVSGGCIDNIKRNLGYRFVLTNGIYPDSPVKAGTEFWFELNVNNLGYASPFNARPVKLIMRNQVSGELFSFDLSADIRRWYSGNTRVIETIRTNASMPAGKYNLLLYLPDAHASIAARPEYAIRLANAGVWESKTGYNNLLATITVSGAAKAW